MSKISINVYTNMDNVIEKKFFNAMFNNGVIKYIDSDNNKIMVDSINNILYKENSDSIIEIYFNEDYIKLFIKDIGKEFIKKIETLTINKEDENFFVKYRLVDEDIVNEYEIKIL